MAESRENVLVSNLQEEPMKQVFVCLPSDVVRGPLSWGIVHFHYETCPSLSPPGLLRTGGPHSPHTRHIYYLVSLYKLRAFLGVANPLSQDVCV